MIRKSQLLASAIVLLLATACNSGSSETSDSSGQQSAQPTVLTIAQGSNPTTLDPQFSTGIPELRLTYYMFDTLLGRDAEGNVKPNLATDWSVAEDGLTWRLKLRDDVLFHDGTPFNADSVKFSFDRILNEETGSPRRSVAAHMREINVISEYEVEIVTTEPFGAFLPFLSAYNAQIVAPAAADISTEEFARNPIGTGAFRFVEWEQDSHVILERNPDYWGVSTEIDRIVVQIVPDDSTRVLMLETGEADLVIGVSPSDESRLTADPEITVHKAPSIRTILLWLDRTKPMMDDIRTRQALNYGINRQEIIDSVLEGNGVPAGAIEAPGIYGAANHLEPYPYDPVRAQELFDEVGVDNLILYYPTGRYVGDANIAQVLQGQLAQYGIDVTIKTQEWTELWATYTASITTDQEMHIGLVGKGSSVGDAYWTLNLLWRPGESFNFGNFEDDRVTKLLDDQLRETDADKRVAMLHEIQEIIHAEHAVVPLTYEGLLYATRSDVLGLDFRSDEMVLLDDARIDR